MPSIISYNLRGAQFWIYRVYMVRKMQLVNIAKKEAYCYGTTMDYDDALQKAWTALQNTFCQEVFIVREQYSSEGKLIRQEIEFYKEK